MPRQLAMQFVFDLIEMLLAAFLLSWVAALGGYVTRVMFVALLGLFPTLAVELPLWNWYGFPTKYMAAQFVVHLVGFLAGGLVLGGIVRKPAAHTT